jgi:hypothetical protein
MKKKNLVFATLFTLAMAFLPGCDLFEECGTCSLITEDADGNIIDEGAALPYCGEDLEEKRNAPPVTVAGVTTYWRCD